MQRMQGLRTWVINLDRAPDRLARISAQLRRLGLPFTRMPAVDARALRPDQAALLDEPAYRRKHGMTPVAGELGCYLSHVEVMRAFLADGDAAFALVLEDDVLLHDSLPSVLRALTGLAARKTPSARSVQAAQPAPWDVVKLSGVHSGTPVAVHPLDAGHKLAVMLSRCTGSSAYLMNRRAAEAYLREPGGLLPMQLPYDHVFDQGWRFGLKLRMVTPWPCGHDETAVSTIGTSAGTTRKFHWTQRLSTYVYRLGNEARRLRHGLAQVLHEKLSG